MTTKFSLKRLLQKTATWIVKRWAAYLWLAVLAVVCYGLLIPKLGFYWDDLPYLYQYAANGPSGFPAYVAPDRPFSAWIFVATTTLFGFNPLGYHVLALVLRWAGAVFFYEICRELWPDSGITAIITASAFLVYPGFSQQPIALIYTHHFSVLAAFLLSLYLMIRYVNGRGNRVINLISSIALAFGMFSIENFSTLELIRPVIIFKILNDRAGASKNKKVPLSTLKLWLPYLAVFAVFLVWRVFIFSFPTYRPEFLVSLAENPIQAIGYLLGRIPIDFFTANVRPWMNWLPFPTVSEFGRLATVTYWGITAAMLLITALFLFALEKSHKEKTSGLNDNYKEAVELLIGSLLLFFFAGSLIWVLDLPVVLDFSDNRLTLAFIPAAALLLGSVYLFLSRRPALKILLVAVVFSMSAGVHFENSMAFKREWETLQSFLSQLSWRVPALAENTIFITSETGLRFFSDSSLTSPINLMYTDDIGSSAYPHLVYTSYSPRTMPWFSENDGNAAYQRIDRSFIFKGNSANAISYRYRPPGCVQILDGTYANSIAIANLTDLQAKELAFTNLDLIKAEPAHDPFAKLFTEEASDSWCYYFEKADLARQNQDYSKVAELGDAAITSALHPRIASEWLPFLEGYLWNGRWERAEWVIKQIRSSGANYTSGMCYTLKRISGAADFPFHEQLSDLISAQPCD